MITKSKNGDARPPAFATLMEGAFPSCIVEKAIKLGIDSNWFNGHCQTHGYHLDLPSGSKAIIEHVVFERASVVICFYIPAAAPVNTEEAREDFETLVTETFAEIQRTAPSGDYSYGFEHRGSLVWIKPHRTEEPA